VIKEENIGREVQYVEIGQTSSRRGGNETDAKITLNFKV
jgi:hypothetical protein